MPRVARMHYPGGVFHVISRFFERRYMLESAEDREKYLMLLGQTLPAADTQLLAYCLMSSHVHLLVRSGSAPLSRLMKPINTGFAVWKNRRLGNRIGPVFADRFKTVLVDHEAYLLTLISYIHNNPVRAGVVKAAQDSTWSSHRSYLGLEPSPSWLNIGFALGMLDREPIRAAQMLSEYVSQSSGEGRRPELSGEGQSGASRMAMRAVGDGWRLSDSIIGDEAFVAKVQADLAKTDAQVVPGSLREVGVAPHLGSRSDQRPGFETVVELTCAALGISRMDFDLRPKSKVGIRARQIIVLLWVHRFRGTQTEVARGLRVLTSNVSRWYKMAIGLATELEPFVDRIEQALRDDKLDLSGWSKGNVRYTLAINEDVK